MGRNEAPDPNQPDLFSILDECGGRIIGTTRKPTVGPACFGYLLGIHPSTGHRMLARYGIAKLRWLDLRPVE